MAGIPPKPTRIRVIASELTTGTESVSAGKKDYAMPKSLTAPKKTLAPIHPGKILLEDLLDEEISINFLARASRVPANRISLIVNGRRSISADTAMRLARFFGTTPQYWMKLQTQDDLACVDKAAIERDVLPRAAA
jgi:addiction module HigA family antidote